MKGIENQPLSRLRWIDRSRLKSNSYNPNKVAPPELKLLKHSILEDGWTQPLVVQPESDEGTHEIIDGFHRWTVSGDKDVFAMTDGLVPCVVVEGFDQAHQKMSTIRHNRARGSHGVVRMTEIVGELLEQGLAMNEISARLGMEKEEIERYEQHGSVEVSMRNLYGEWQGFSKAWEPAAVQKPVVEEEEG